MDNNMLVDTSYLDAFQSPKYHLRLHHIYPLSPLGADLRIVTTTLHRRIVPLKPDDRAVCAVVMRLSLRRIFKHKLLSLLSLSWLDNDLHRVTISMMMICFQKCL